MFKLRTIKSAITALVIALFAFALTDPASASATVLGVNCPSSYGPVAWSYTRAHVFTTSNRWCDVYPKDNLGMQGRVVWQSDGNLVAYLGAHSAGRVAWASNTNGRGHELAFQKDGNLVIYNSAHRALWSTRTSNLQAGFGMTYKFGLNTYRHCSVRVHAGQCGQWNRELELKLSQNGSPLGDANKSWATHLDARAL